MGFFMFITIVFAVAVILAITVMVYLQVYKRYINKALQSGSTSQKK